MAQNKEVRTVIKDGEEPQPIEILESSIVEIAKGFKRVQASRITRETLVTLIESKCNAGKPAIRDVLNTLDSLESLFLKPKTKKS